jgi:hypothetical protein
MAYEANPDIIEDPPSESIKLVIIYKHGNFRLCELKFAISCISLIKVEIVDRQPKNPKVTALNTHLYSGL